MDYMRFTFIQLSRRSTTHRTTLGLGHFAFRISRFATGRIGSGIAYYRLSRIGKNRKTPSNSHAIGFLSIYLSIYLSINCPSTFTSTCPSTRPSKTCLHFPNIQHYTMKFHSLQLLCCPFLLASHVASSTITQNVTVCSLNSR